MHSKIIDRAEQEHGFVDRDWPPRLIETYAPIHAETLGRVVGVAELYQRTDELARETDAAQRRSWLVVTAAMATMYALLFGLVRRGSETIARQRRELDDRVTELSALVARNAQLDARVRGAAARTTALNERFLRRIATDLHDGPGQDLGFALMRVETMTARAPADGRASRRAAARTCRRCARGSSRRCATCARSPRDCSCRRSSALRADGDRGARHSRLRAQDRREASRSRATGTAADVALPVKITLYRLLQESLANGFRHAGGAGQRVTLAQDAGQIVVEVRDDGPGFDAQQSASAGGVGLAGHARARACAGGRVRTECGTRARHRDPRASAGVGARGRR